MSLPSVILEERTTSKMVEIHLNVPEAAVDVCTDP
jgi:hypothetical protein